MGCRIHLRVDIALDFGKSTVGGSTVVQVCCLDRRQCWIQIIRVCKRIAVRLCSGHCCVQSIDESHDLSGEWGQSISAGAYVLYSRRCSPKSNNVHTHMKHPQRVSVRVSSGFRCRSVDLTIFPPVQRDERVPGGRCCHSRVEDSLEETCQGLLLQWLRLPCHD